MTRRAPLMTGRASGAACHETVWPLLPESAAVNSSGVVRRYTPSASRTTMSPIIQRLSALTLALAWSSEHGLLAEQAVPVPVGDA